MKKLISIFLFTLFSSYVGANTLSCGSSVATVKNTETPTFPYFLVDIAHESYTVIHKFHSYYRFFKIKCTQDVNGKTYYLIKSNAGGSGSLDNLSLIDSSNGKLVVTSESQPVTPEQRRKLKEWGNYSEIEKVLGLKPQYFSCKIREKTKDEICIVSNVELG